MSEPSGIQSDDEMPAYDDHEAQSEWEAALDTEAARYEETLRTALKAKERTTDERTN